MTIKWDWQTLACCILLGIAVVYVFRSIRKSFKVTHDCPDCGVGEEMKKIKSHAPAKKG